MTTLISIGFDWTNMAEILLESLYSMEKSAALLK